MDDSVQRLAELEVGERPEQDARHPQRLRLEEVRSPGGVRDHQDRHVAVDGAHPPKEAAPVGLRHVADDQGDPGADLFEPGVGIAGEDRDQAGIGDHLGQKLPRLLG
jgi:hypothetical protein